MAAVDLFDVVISGVGGHAGFSSKHICFKTYIDIYMLQNTRLNGVCRACVCVLSLVECLYIFMFNSNNFYITKNNNNDHNKPI
jgi:hypothetical protein